jgi:hypothetical protein
MLLLRQRNLLSHVKVLTENVYSTDKLFSTAATTRASLVSEQLMSRVAVRVGGSEATAFLQGLITNDIHLLDKAKSMFTVFLNVQVYNLIGMIKLQLFYMLSLLLTDFRFVSLLMIYMVSYLDS